MSSILPDFTLNEEAKKTLAWLMYEIKKDASTVIILLGRHFHLNKKQGRACFNLHEVLKLRESCGEAEINSAQLLADLKYRIKLKELGLTTEDLPHLLETAESMAQAGISYRQCAEFLKLKGSLKKAGIHIENIEQLQANIESVSKLVGMPEEKILELASWLAETYKLKENLESLQVEKQKAERTLEGTRREISLLKKERITRDKELCDVTAEIEGCNNEYAELVGRLEQLKAITHRHDIAIKLVVQFYQFLLSSKVRSYDQLWTALKKVFDFRKSHGNDELPAPPELCEAVRKELVDILREIVDEDLVPSWEKDQWRRLDKIEVAEALCQAPSEALVKAEEGMKKINEGMDDVRNAKLELERSLERIKRPYSNA